MLFIRRGYFINWNLKKLKGLGLLTSLGSVTVCSKLIKQFYYTVSYINKPLKQKGSDEYKCFQVDIVISMNPWKL